MLHTTIPSPLQVLARQSIDHNKKPGMVGRKLHM
jgi:hypothetical protein